MQIEKIITQELNLLTLRQKRRGLGFVGFSRRVGMMKLLSGTHTLICLEKRRTEGRIPLGKV